MYTTIQIRLHNFAQYNEKFHNNGVCEKKKTQTLRRFQQRASMINAFKILSGMVVLFPNCH